MDVKGTSHLTKSSLTVILWNVMNGLPDTQDTVLPEFWEGFWSKPVSQETISHVNTPAISETSDIPDSTTYTPAHTHMHMHTHTSKQMNNGKRNKWMEIGRISVSLSDSPLYLLECVWALVTSVFPCTCDKRKQCYKYINSKEINRNQGHTSYLCDSRWQPRK